MDKNMQMEFLQQALLANGHDLALSQREQILHYLQKLQQWNRIFNLTRIDDFKDMVMRHVLDSLSIGLFLSGEKILDVGSGGGLPGIPLAIMYPERSFVLIDKSGKKARFLTQMVCELKLKNVRIIEERVENVSLPDAALFDCIMARAFSSLTDMVLCTEHLIKPNGQFLAMKGTYPQDEIDKVPKQFKVLKVERLEIKGLNRERHLVCLQKGSIHE